MDAPPSGLGGASSHPVGLIRRAFASSRFLMILTVLSTFATAAALLIFDALLTIEVIADAVTGLLRNIDTDYARNLAVQMLTIIDLALLGIVFFVISLGVYQLFIDDQLELPQWLRIDDLDDLKGKLISVVVTLLGVYFLEIVVTGNGGGEILTSGLGIGAVVAALSIFAGGLRRSS
jgi:uncharacterized membrane protein YqhA